MGNHTPEPWTYRGPAKQSKLDSIIDKSDDYAILSQEGLIIAETFERVEKDRLEPSYANADRIVACVNGCHGIDPKLVPELVALFKEMAEHLDYTCYGDAWERECADHVKLPNRVETLKTKLEVK